MDDFVKFLKHKQIVPVNQRSYYVKWVVDLFNHCGKRPGQALQHSEINQFMAHLAKTRKDWQVQQAIDAIRLHQNFESKPDQIRVHVIYTLKILKALSLKVGNVPQLRPKTIPSLFVNKEKKVFLNLFPFGATYMQLVRK